MIYKRVRVFASLFFFTCIVLLFLDFKNLLPGLYYNIILSLQIIPAILKSISMFGYFAIGVALVLLLTIFYGRIYCSTICPLGTLQDFVIKVSNTINRRRYYNYKKTFYWIHYLLLTLIIVSFFYNSLLILNLLEPYSNFGRILTNIFNPTLLFIKNHLSEISFLNFVNEPILQFSISVFISSLSFLLLIIYLSYFHGRIFCNLLCPAGALLGIISRLSFYKIKIDNNACTSCGLCERVCKANCIDSKSKKIDFASCIGCFNCLAICNSKSLSYKFRYKNIEHKTDSDRRNILQNIVRISIASTLPSILFSQQNRNRNRNQNQRKREKSPITPPGSLSIEHFTNYCTACHLCINACPTKVLRPSLMEYGLSGIFQPLMDFKKSYCNYDCVICGNVCPTGAIKSLTISQKQETQIGKVRFHRRHCVVVTDNTDCGSCAEHCPTQAVSMIPFRNNLMIPTVDTDICVGCGACEHVCPAEPEKAITVDCNITHEIALPPKKSKKIEPVTTPNSSDFPF